MFSRVLQPLFRYFETRVDPYPMGDVQTPPQGLIPLSSTSHARYCRC